MENSFNRNICRICFQEQTTLFPLFIERRDSSCRSWSPYHQLVNRTELKIAVDDGGPTSICVQCLTDLETTVNFLEKCEKSNEILASLYSSCARPFESKIVVKDVMDGNENCSETGNYKNSDQNQCGVDAERSKSASAEEVVDSTSRCPECGSGRRCQHWTPPATHRCPLCHKEFTRKFNFKLHLKRHSGEREFPCASCGRRQVTRCLAARHCRPRPRRACPQPGCLKTFTTNTNLRTHLTTHTGERPHACVECGKTFTSKNTLNDHKRIHTGVKPYMCAECGARFATNKLAAHLRSHRRGPADRGVCAPGAPGAPGAPRAAGAPQPGAAPHACRACPARYRHSQSLNKHVRRHHQNIAESKPLLEKHQ
ncbi:replication initiator 1-like [Achroia grisella]|uniref:replication initiator 1-like n=1 Tax=Achroia grisella TaxID=688607 RepID=UPI0027D31058|nr:replication initiator 1-like [Achroia grisella]